MGIAICFKCGSEKSGALITCRKCSAAPQTNSERAVSLAFSDQMSSKDQLARYSHELRNGQKLSVPHETVRKAFDALKDPQLLAMLRAQRAVQEPAPVSPPSRIIPHQSQALHPDPSTSIAVPGTAVLTQGGVLCESLGIETIGNFFTTIIAKGSKLPNTASQSFSTAEDGQNQIELNLCIGNSSISTIYRSLGRFQISGIVPMPMGEPSILVEFKVDQNGVSLKASDNHSKSPLSVKFIPSPPQPTPQPKLSTPPRATPDPQPFAPPPRFAATALNKSPFALLGVTTRDDRRRIIELAEEKSLELDLEHCRKARSDLTNPRTRLSAEIAWLPGVSPRKAIQLVESLRSDPMALRRQSGLPTLAHLNLLASAFETVKDSQHADDLAEFIQEIANLTEKLSPKEVLSDINEDRSVSGFPEIKSVKQIEEEYSERKRYYRTAIKETLDRLPSAKLVLVMTKTIDRATLGGCTHAPELIDDLVDSYELETQGFLQKEAENVHKLIKAARASASLGEAAVKPYVDKLDVVARNWDKVAQPIQLSAKARGIDHEASRDLAYEIRSLAIDLFNTHDMLTQSQRIMGLIQELFAELPEVSERVEQDTTALADILGERKQALARRDEWAREITYHAKIGAIFKDTLSISPDGISWKGQSFPLDAITRVRWGGVSRSVNGIPTGTTYTIAFGDRRTEAVVELKNEDVYSKFVDKLWRAVCVRLLGEMLEALKAGRDLYFGDALLHDDGITLVKRKFLSSSEKVRCSWEQVQIWNADGSFCIGFTDDKKTNAAISYILVANTHILEQAIRMAFKQPGLRRLSDLLQ